MMSVLIIIIFPQALKDIYTAKYLSTNLKRCISFKGKADKTKISKSAAYFTKLYEKLTQNRYYKTNMDL